MGFIKLKTAWKICEYRDNQYYLSAKKPEGIDLIEHIPYVDDGMEEHLLDIARPAGNEDILPVIINIHGGGWIYGSKDSHYKYYGMNIAKGGYAVITMNYRLAPEHKYPAQIEDVFSVINFIYKNAKKYKLDPNNIFLVGDSAGAYLAAYAGCITTNNTLRNYYMPYSNIAIRGLGLNCGVYDFNELIKKDFAYTERVNTIKALFGAKDFKNLYKFQISSVINNSTKKFIPSFIMGTEADRLYSHTDKLINKLKNHNVKHRAKIYKKERKLPHVFHCRDTFKESRETMDDMLNFFNKLRLEKS